MYELTATLQFAQTISNVLIFAEAVESTIYNLDAKFQEHVTPWVQDRAIATITTFIRATYLTFIAGENTREWFDAWLAGYVVSGIPTVESHFILEPETQLLLPAPQIEDPWFLPRPILSLVPVVVKKPEVVQPIKLLPEKTAKFSDLNIEESVKLTDMTIRELRAIARQKGIKKYGSMSKARLVEVLST